MEGNTTTTPTKRNRIVPVILALVIISGGLFGVQKYYYYRTHEDTDDAQVDGDLSAVVARAGGYVDSIAIEDNQRVNAGQLLIRLEDKEYKLKLEQALAAQKLAGSRIDVSATEITTMEATANGYKAMVDAAKARLWQANQDYNRYAQLVKNGAVPRQQFDKAQSDKDAATAAYASAVAQYNAAMAKTNNSRTQLQVTHTALDQQQVDVDYAQLQLSYTQIKAPVTGIVTKRRIQKGQLIQPGQTLFAVVDENSLYITANFKETQMEHIRPGQEVAIEVDAYPGHKITGKVHNFAGTTGAKISLLPPDNATGNFVKVVQRIPVKISIEASAEVRNLLRPGMNVTVSVSTKN
ncbi:HlyD family secretion protein [Chitinophaga nivalis]|uniref:HlyD family secretion protein n=1 Tax=Chitinophaga nivalis TaxID=2991709 RepID=A0ABT3IKP9_9BACT|nr:HlyD family secretion protein [Chitinophaga nivalis]MCW3465776.1 HlyD family secretion protein [Chitinophaga nivalis]MCW3484533.1 HlyD family secretion protein [Chitinophaga nivalis]